MAEEAARAAPGGPSVVGKYLVQADQTAAAAAAASGGAAKTASLLGELPEHIPGTPTPDEDGDRLAPQPNQAAASGQRRNRARSGTEEMGRLKRRITKSNEEYQEMFDGRSIKSMGSVAAAMAEVDPLSWFRILDADNSGTIEKKEFMQLVEKLHIPLKKHQLTTAFKEMDRHENGKITYTDFSAGWNMKKEYESRVLRRTIRELWNRADENGDGSLDKDEVARLLNRSYTRRVMASWQPPFDLEDDWGRMCSKGAMDAGSVYEGPVVSVTYTEFEFWWKRRNGIDDVDIPVFPEYMVEHIGNAVKEDHVRNGRYFWKFLIPRLKRIVNMQQYWGNVHHLYKSHPVSIYSELPLGSCMRDPESYFSMAWDMVQIILLIYVATQVPFRSGFGITTPPGSFWFTLEIFVDLYFIADVVINFRTSFYGEDGIREDRPNRIARRYLKGWFFIDFISCVPVQYFYLETDEESGKSSPPDDLRVAKVVRLLRLSKMLRLARIKKLMLKYQQSFTFNQYLGVVLVLSVMMFLSHLVCCFWHMIGQMGDQESQFVGWVFKMESCNCNSGFGDCGGIDLALYDVSSDESFELSLAAQNVTPCWTQYTAISDRYVTSLYLAFNSLEPIYETPEERGLGLVAGVVMMPIIFGAIAALMSSLIMSLQGGEKAFQDKVRAVRDWLVAKNIDQEISKQALKYINMKHQHQSSMNEADLLAELPPTLSREISRRIYTTFLASVPLFRGLSDEVILKLCEKMTPMLAMKTQQIILEGHVGSELYLVLKGEVEVTKEGNRLGFLSEGSFFGEIPILSPNDIDTGMETQGSEVRVRSVTAVTECELCYIDRLEMRLLQKRYDELELRMRRFARVSTAKRGIKKLIAEVHEEKEINSKFVAVVEPGSPKAGGANGVSRIEFERMEQKLDSLTANMSSVESLLQQVLAKS